MRDNVVAKPQISFIIPVLNGERDIRRCLLSLGNMNFPEENYEVFVIDNGSTDSTQQIVRDLGFNLQIIPGVTVAALRNYGASAARGDYLAFVDADVEVMPCWPQGALAAFEKELVVAAGCFPRAPRPATWVQQSWEVHQCGDQNNRLRRRVPWLPSMNLLVRHEVFLRIKGFNEDLVTAEDVDLCYRLGQHGSIIDNPAMEAVHWGEAADLQTFWQKEVWRGMGSLKGVVRHGLRLDELPSLAYPLYLLALLPLLGISCFLALSNSKLAPIIINLSLLLVPALSLAIRTCWRTKKFHALPGLCLLYFLYGIARASSLINLLAGKLPNRSHDQTIRSLYRP